MRSNAVVAYTEDLEGHEVDLSDERAVPAGSTPETPYWLDAPRPRTPGERAVHYSHFLIVRIITT